MFNGNTYKLVELRGRANRLGEWVKKLTVEKAAEELRTQFGLGKWDRVMVETGASDWTRRHRENHESERYTAAEYAEQVRPLVAAIELAGARILLVSCHQNCFPEEKQEVAKILGIPIVKYY